MTDSGTIVAGRYRLNKKLDDVNQATIWDAYDTALQRRVLVRLLRADLSGDDAAVERFRGDVRAAALSGSPDRPRVLDAGNDTVTQAPFVVLEWRQELASPAAGQHTTASSTVRNAPRTASAPADSSAGSPQDGPSARTTVLRMPAVARVVPRSRGPGRMVRAAEVLVVGILLIVPLGLGALAISNWLSQPSAVVPELFSLPAAPDLNRPSAGAPPAAGAAATAPAAAAKAPVDKPAPPPTLAPPPTPAVTATPVLSGDRRRVANTDGQGVALRATAGGERQPGRGYDEGATVTLLEESGTWARIRGDDGREGWVLAVTLVP